MTLKQTPSPVKDRSGSGQNGHTGQNGHAGPGAGGEAPAGPPVRRNSIFPFLLDLGVVVGLFGLVIVGPLYNALIGNVVLGLGGLLALAALVGWVREARAEYARTPD